MEPFNVLVDARYGKMLCNRYDTYIGRSIVSYGEFSEGEADLFRQMLRPGQWVVEAGANIGALTLPISQFVGDQGRVIAFEPQRIVFQTLCANMALNSVTNVVCRCEGVGDSIGSLLVPNLDYRKPNNFGGCFLMSEGRGETVPVVTIDSLQLPACHLIKADVEGMELSVVRGAAETIERCRPLLYLENDRKDKSPPLLGYLLELGYVLYRHFPLLYSSKNFRGNAENIFPDVISANVLGIHKSYKANISGLKEITSADDWWETQV